MKILIFTYNFIFWIFDKIMENFKRVMLYSFTFLFCHFCINMATHPDVIIKDLRMYMNVFWAIVLAGGIVNTFIKTFFPEHFDHNHIIGSIPYYMLLYLMGLLFLIILPGTAKYV